MHLFVPQGIIIIIQLMFVSLSPAVFVPRHRTGLEHESSESLKRSGQRGRGSDQHFNDLGRYLITELFMNSLRLGDSCVRDFT